MFCIKGATALQYSYFGHGQAPHILSYVRCYSYGSYNSLLQCSHNAASAAINCGDGAVASVVCAGNTRYILRFHILFIHMQNLVLTIP